MEKSLVKKFLAISIFMLFVEAGIVSAYNQNKSNDNKPQYLNITWYVGGSGPGNYSKIQDAIDNASAGDIVFVYNGIYKEHVFINKQIHLIGESKSNTTIDGSGLGDIITIFGNSANGTSISKFTITSTGSKGILVSFSSNVLINDTNIHNCYIGIHCWHCTNILIDGNIITNTNYGIYLEYTDHSYIEKYNHILNNTVGMILWNINAQNKVNYNEIKNNLVWGLIIAHGTGNEIYNNNFIDNGKQAPVIVKWHAQVWLHNGISQFHDNYYSDHMLPFYIIRGGYRLEYFISGWITIPIITLDLRAATSPNTIQ
jgi:parallel beta-helix repeat protein